MEERADGPKHCSLLVEGGSARLVVQGQRVVVARRQSALLAQLALHAGEPVEASELIKSVWDERPGMTLNDLHVLVKRVRRRLEELGVDSRLLVNVKGVGYLLDPEIADVTILDAVGAQAAAEVASLETQRPSRELGAIAPAASVGVVAQASGASSAAESDVSRAPRPTSVSPGARRRWLVGATAAVFASVAFGFVAANLATDAPEPRDEIAARPEPSSTPGDARKAQEPKKTIRPSPKPRRQRPRGRRPAQSSGGVAVVGAPIAAPAPATAPPASRSSEPRKQQSVSLPPPPTRYLYHLFNPDNGDHFVTTDGGAVTEHEAKGYEGGPIGRVYHYAEKGTKAIAINYGSAFVFLDASPKTDPASATLPLWYSTNNAGDFFYSTSNSEASQDGWSATLIGYVRSL